MKEVEEINVKPFEMKGLVSKNTATRISGVVNAMSEVYGDKKDEIEALAAAPMAAAFNSKVPYNNTQVEPDVVRQISESVKTLIDRLDEDLAADPSPKTSYAYRSKVAARRFIQMTADGSYDLLLNEDSVVDTYRTGSFNNYPQPLFKTDPNKSYSLLGDFTRDDKKFEEYMAKHPFLEQLEDRQDYEEKYKVPYLRNREAGTLSDAQRREYIFATYEHLKRQKAYFADLLSIDREDKEINSIYPFGKSGTVALKGDWLGPRFGEKRAVQIDREMKALENGWSPDDFEMIHNIYDMVERSIGADDAVPEQQKAQARSILDSFTKTKIHNLSERRAALDSLKPVYDTYKQYNNVEKSPDDYCKGFEYQQKKYNDAMASTYPIVIVDADERERQELIESLEGFLRGLNTGHRVGWHSDTDEMRELKNKTRDVIRLLKNSTDTNLFEDDNFRAQMDELGKKADFYTGKKREKFEKKVREELTDPDVAEGTSEWKVQEDKIKDKLLTFKPDSKMGETRYKSAQKMADVCKKFVKEYNGQKKQRTEWKKFTDKGYDTVRMKDIKAGGVRPFDGGIKEILNYYTKKPAFIPEHLALNIFDLDSFDKTCKPIECKGVTDEEFALTAFAAVQDTSMLPPDPKEDLKMCTAAESYEQKRTMYTLDLQKIHRAGAIRDYGEKIILPARLRAKEAINKYTKGDKEPLANLLATGIKKIAYECAHDDHIKDRNSNFSVNTEMLAKLINLAKKDDAVYEAVQSKLGPETKQEIQDSMNLKELLDKCEREEWKSWLKTQHSKK